MAQPTIQRGYQTAPEGRAGTLPSADEQLRRMEWDKSEKIEADSKLRNELTEELGVPQRLAKSLADAGLETIEDLKAALAEGVVHQIQGVGKGHQRGLNLAVERGQWNKPAGEPKAAPAKPLAVETPSTPVPLSEPTQPVFKDADGGVGITEHQVIRLVMDRVKAGVLDGREPNQALKADPVTVLRHLRKALEFMGKELS